MGVLMLLKLMGARTAFYKMNYLCNYYKVIDLLYMQSVSLGNLKLEAHHDKVANRVAGKTKA